MAISVNRGAKVDLNLLETLEQARPATYAYITANGGLNLSTAPAKIYAVFADADGLGAFTLYNSTGASNPFFSRSLSIQTAHNFGPSGLLLPLGLSIVTSGAGSPTITIIYAA